MILSIAALLMGLAAPASAQTSRLDFVRHLEAAVGRDGRFEAEARSFAAACGLRESRFFSTDRTITPVRRDAEAWWIDLLFSLSGVSGEVIACNREILYGLLPRPWNADLVEVMRSHLRGGDYEQGALQLLAYGRLLNALPVRLTPAENDRAVMLDIELANVLLGETPLQRDRAGQTFKPEISRLLHGQRAIEIGSAAVLPRATTLSCAGIL